MTLDEILRILRESGEVADIQGLSRDGPFTILYVDGTQEKDVTLAELQQLAVELGPQPSPTGRPTAQAQPRPSTGPAPGEPDPTEKPEWWDESQDGNWESQKWDTRKYGQYPAKVNKDNQITGPDYPTAEAQRKREDARQEKPLSAGRPQTQVRGGQEYAYNPKTGEYDDFLGSEQEEKREAEVVTLDGQRLIRQPGGNVTAFPGGNRSLDQMLIDSLEAGDLAEQERVLNLMDRVEALRNRPRPMNDQEIFDFLAPIAQNPQHFEELLRAFRQDVGQQAPMVSFEQKYPPAAGPVRAPGTAVGREQELLGGNGVMPPGRFEATEEEEFGGPAETEEQKRQREAQTRVLQDAFRVERTGSFDPDRPAFGRLGPAGSMPGMRTEGEEGWLGWFLGTRNQAAARGVGVPPEMQERFSQITAKAPFKPPQLQMPGQAPADIMRQQPAFSGTEFFPLPTGNVLQEKYTRDYNELQQERFKRRRVPQVRFG